MSDSNSGEKSKVDGGHEKPAGTIRKFGKLLSERWPEYILEIIVVIIGISISFAINNYQTDAANRTLEQMYLTGLLEDINSDVDELEEAIFKTRAVLENGSLLVKQSLKDEPTLSSQEFIRHVRAIAERPNYISKNATFSALKSSGNFNLLLDNQLKALLFEYDQQYQGLKSLEMAELQLTAAITAPYIIKSIPIADSLATDNNHTMNINVKRVLNDIEFLNNVALRRSTRQELFESYTETLQVATNVRNALQKNIRQP